MPRVLLLTKIGIGASVLCLAGPSLLDFKIGIAFVIGLTVIAVIFFRNRWNRTASAVTFVAILNVYSMWSALYYPKWQVWAKNLPVTIGKGTPEKAVIRSLWWRSSMLNVRTEGSKSFIDIHPVGPAGWIKMNYWRVILDLDPSRNVITANSTEVRW